MDTAIQLYNSKVNEIEARIEDMSAKLCMSYLGQEDINAKIRIGRISCEAWKTVNYIIRHYPREIKLLELDLAEYKVELDRLWCKQDRHVWIYVLPMSPDNPELDMYINNFTGSRPIVDIIERLPKRKYKPVESCRHNKSYFILDL